jgi:alcohol dehydrogenase
LKHVVSGFREHIVAELKSFHARTKVLFGIGVLSDLGDLARQFSSKTVLVVIDPALEQTGLFERLRSIFGKTGLGIEIFSDVEPEPYLDNADGAASLGRRIGAEAVVGIGGGSAMDTAKAAAALMTNEGLAETYVGLELLRKPAVPTIMVPTTSGTGSEVTFTAVFTNRNTKAKGGMNSSFLFPDVALLDPELTVSLPPNITAATGMDALTHAIESVTSLSSTVFTEALSLKAVSLISQNLRRAVYHGDDIRSRENMLYGSLLAGLGLANAGVGACHALAYPLGGNYRIPHGLANAILIPHVMQFNLPAAERTMAMVAQSMGEPVDGMPLNRAAEAAVEAVSDLCLDIGIPSSLMDLGIPNEDIPVLVEGALKVTRPVENNPRRLGKEEAYQIYENAFAY